MVMYCAMIKTREAIQRRNRKTAEQRKVERAAGVNRAKYILYDSRQEDKRRGRQNDLDRGFITALISGACVYCGETKLMMSLDRIDNTIGHLRANVKAACMRCNYIRRDMPYEAWIKLAPTIRHLMEAGLFGQWGGGGPWVAKVCS